MALVDMELDDEGKLDAPMPFAMPEKPDYPYGLRICLCKPELDKLGLEPDCEVGDMLDIRAFAVVTSVTKDENSSRVELQIQKMACANEMDE